jgi:hypothetical protein
MTGLVAARGRVSGRLPVALLTLLSLLLVSVGAVAADTGPVAAARAFCRLDALGVRLEADNLALLDDWVAWELEPAWDEVVLISGYSIGEPVVTAGGVATVAVEYQLVGRLSVGGLDAQVQRERVVLHLAAPADRWLVAGPPPVPHVFADRADIGAIRRSLAPTSGYISASAFVWRALRAAGWAVDHVATSELLAGETLREVTTPAPGDLVLYLTEDRPYHVGLLESADVVVSATVRRGVTRAPLAAFAGAVRYARLTTVVRRLPTRTPIFIGSRPTPDPAARKPMRPTALPAVRATPQPPAPSTPGGA